MQLEFKRSVCEEKIFSEWFEVMVVVKSEREVSRRVKGRVLRNNARSLQNATIDEILIIIIMILIIIKRRRRRIIIIIIINKKKK